MYADASDHRKQDINFARHKGGPLPLLMIKVHSLVERGSLRSWQRPGQGGVQTKRAADFVPPR